jgi:hypothetical protein
LSALHPLCDLAPARWEEKRNIVRKAEAGSPVRGLRTT